MAQVHEGIAEMKTSTLTEIKSEKPVHIQYRATALEKMLCLPQMGDTGFHADDISIPISPKVSEKFSSCNKTIGSSIGTGIVRDTSKKLLYSYTLKSDVKKDVSGIQFDTFQIEPSPKSIANIRTGFRKSKAVDMLKVANYELYEHDGPEILLKVSEISFESVLPTNYTTTSNVKKFFTGFCEIEPFQIQPMRKKILSTKAGSKNLKRVDPLDEVSNEPSFYDETQASLKNPKFSSERTMSTSNLLKNNAKKEFSEFQADSIKIHSQNKNITNFKRDSQNLKRGDPLDAVSNESSICDGKKTAVKTRTLSSERMVPTNKNLKKNNKKDSSELQVDLPQIQPKKMTNIERDSQNSKRVDRLVVSNESSICDGTKAAVKACKHLSERMPPTNNTLKSDSEKDSFELQVVFSHIQPQNKNITNIKRDSLNSKRVDPLDTVSNESSICDEKKAAVKTSKHSSERATSIHNTVKGSNKNDPECNTDSSEMQPKNKNIANIKRDSQNSKKADVVVSNRSSVCGGTKALLKVPIISTENTMSSNDQLKGNGKIDKQIQPQNRNVTNTRNNSQTDSISDAASNEISTCDGTKTSVKVLKIASDKTPSTKSTLKSNIKTDVQIQPENKNITNTKTDTQNLQKVNVLDATVNKSSISDGIKTSVEVPKISSDKNPSTNTTLKTYVKKDLKIQPENKNITNTKRDSQNSQTKYSQEVVSNESSKCDETKKSIKVSKISSEKTLTNSALKSNVKRDLQVQSEKKIVINNRNDSQNSQKTNVLEAVSNDSSISDGTKTVKVSKISSEKTIKNAIKSNVRNDLKVQSVNKIVTNTKSDLHKSQKANSPEEANIGSFICDETKAEIKKPKISPKNVLSSNLTLKENTKEEFSKGQVGLNQTQPQNKSVSNTRNDYQNSNEPLVCDGIKELFKIPEVLSERVTSIKQPTSTQGTLQIIHSPTEGEKQEAKLQNVFKRQPQGISELKVVRELACKLIHEKMKKLSSHSLIHENIPVQDAVAERADLLYCKGRRLTEKDHSKPHTSSYTIRKDTKRLEQVVKDLCHTIMACAPGIENPSQVISYLEHLTKTVFSCKHLGPRLTSHDNIRDLITHRLFCTRGNNSDLFSSHLHPLEKDDIFNHFRRELDNLRLRVKFPDKWP